MVIGCVLSLRFVLEERLCSHHEVFVLLVVVEEVSHLIEGEGDLGSCVREKLRSVVHRYVILY